MEMKAQVAELKGHLKSLSAIAVANALAIFGMAEHTAHAANEVRLAALRTGTSAEEFQKMSYAAKMSGVDTEGFAHALMFLNRNMFSARQGSKETMQSFAMLGGNVAKAVAQGQKPSEVFKLIADRFQNIKDPAKAGALAMNVFGRAGAELLPVLKKGSAGIEEFGKKAEEMGLVFSDETIEDAHEFHEAFEDLKGSLVGFKNSVGAALIKPVGMIIRAVADWMKQNQALIKSQLMQFFKGLQTSLSIVLVVLKRVGEGVAGVAKMFGGLGTALRVIITLFSALKLLEFLGSLGKMVQLLGTLQLAWKGVAAAETIADLAAAAIPVAIGAAILLVIALIEDLIGYFQGKNSLIGVIENAFKERFPQAFAFLQNLLNKSLDWFRAWGKVVSDIFMFIPNKLAEFAPSLFAKGNISAPNLASANGAPVGKSSSGGFGENPFIPSVPSQIPAEFAANSSNVSMGDINVTVSQSNADPHEIGDAVHEAVFKKGFDKVLRPAGRALAPSQKY